MVSMSKVKICWAAKRAKASPTPWRASMAAGYAARVQFSAWRAGQDGEAGLIARITAALANEDYDRTVLAEAELNEDGKRADVI